MANNLLKLRQAYEYLHEHPNNIVLATIVETMGSSYQKAGARMLIAQDGELTGLLGGGCFEADLFEQAQSVFDDGQARLVFYDMRAADDALWGLGLGCNGAVRILLQLLSAENDFHPLNVMAQSYHETNAAVLATVCVSRHVDYPAGYSCFIDSSGAEGVLRNVKREDQLFVSSAQQTLRQKKSCLIEHEMGAERSSVFYDILRPPTHLLIIGAGPDAVPLVQFASSLGWRVTVIDHRPAYIRPERFPDVERLMKLSPDEFNRTLPLDQYDALVLMTHSIDYDQRYLRVIVDSSIPYIGLLGPASRRQRLMDGLGSAAEKITARVHGPVGLDIGADTPEEIALSIVAEIQAVISHRDGAQLHLSDLPLHERVISN